ncbi:hypothetical protein PTKIN_Ptkin13bG0098300 [Pterospermum kingtungense]
MKTTVVATYCERPWFDQDQHCPVELVELEIFVSRPRFAGVDMRKKVKGRSHTSWIYAIYQSVVKGLIAF